MGFLKNFLKDKLTYYRIRERFSPAVQISQRQLYLSYLSQKEKGEIPKLNDTGFRVFSQFEEDGKLLFILSMIGMKTKQFLEIGSDDGINSNCANLAFNFGYHGLFVDGNSSAIKRGEKFYKKHPHPYMYAPKFVCTKITAENINEIVSSAGFNGDIDVMSIDIDGNDYWIWKALQIVQPRVVIIETHVEFGLNDIVVPYDPNYMYPGKHPVYHGASPKAMVKLAKSKGYRLVGANELGFNFIFVRNDEGQNELTEVTLDDVLNHPSVKESWKLFEPIKSWNYVTENFE